MSYTNHFMAVVLCTGACLLTGCQSESDESLSTQQVDGQGGDEVVAMADDHSGWWCREHGVPESECPLCDTSLLADFQAKGDWCDEHNRPDSQCFKCHPENFEAFAARYEAKFGERPPAPTM
ncbi:MULTISPECIES: hypothetical protein [Crateriforma]|uniref:RND transporter n=1 Tax=Crateriforma conspicua TaxID=2527996 RepID=A0A5C6FSD9_9PLAN|nr:MULTISPECIES: hypothetical protein [Crateriforma]TWU63061.1 hypothetical protein V7x_47990 [Crateriforma conspicua]